MNKVHSFDPADSWKYVEMDEFMETVLGRIWRTLQSSAKDPFLLVCLVFFGYGTMEVVWNLGQYILILFFVVQHPLFYEKASAQGAGQIKLRLDYGSPTT